ncbi:MAG: restriction endonuclease [Acidobacteria bacterium]|nr:restriction endonuclease [Acidobacteriota bacterium]
MAKWIVQAAALPGWVVIVAQHSGPLSASDIEDLTTINTDVRLGSPDSTVEQVVAVPAAATASPDDRLEAALAELRHTVRAELLETLADVAPTFFETIVLEVLHKMGYGTSRADLQQVGGPGDAGIDGIISLDRLGLEKVYVQAKKWQNVVGRPEVQAFYGALAGQRANKGVFITTSSFTSQAVDFARSVERVVLVDGAKLTDLMIEHEVGVTLRPVKVPKIDTDYFEE